MLKPYFVELKVTAVVMADSLLQAHLVAEENSFEIVRDSELSTDAAVPIESLEHLARLEPEWTGDCIPYGGDKNTPLKDLIPLSSPLKDIHTMDIFEN
ncbi:MAG: hypothetical protein Q7K26_01515 [bacterium]|nr:hypothetical protein [bacterium]